MNEKLKEFGFVCIESKPTYKTLSCLLNKRGKDRFETEITIYTDDPDTYYINRHFFSGTKTISIEEVMVNHNSLNYSAKSRLIEFIAEFPNMNCAI